jgi:hypothetical protein
MSDNTPNKPVNGVRLSDEELERVAGGLVFFNSAEARGLCSTCNWSTGWTSLTDAQSAVDAHRATYPNHNVGVDLSTNAPEPSR